MKKALIILMALTCLLGLVGCDPGAMSIDKEEVLHNTLKIELFYYENEKPKLLRTGGWRKPVLDFDKATLIATLDESRFEEVVTDIAEQEFLVFGSFLNEPIGKTMILYQRNGNMLVFYGCLYKNEKIGTRYYGDCILFDENGRFIEYLADIGHDYVDELEEKYFQSSI